MNSYKLQDVRQTPQYAAFMQKIGWQVKKINNTSIFIKKLPFLPLSVIKILRYQPPINFKAKKALLVKLEPLEIEKTNGSQVYFKLFKKTNFPLTPTKTIWLYLTKSDSQLLSEMKPKNRYNLKKAQKSNLKTLIIPGNKITRNNLTDFYQLWSKNKPFDFIFRPSFKELKALRDSFKKKCFFVSLEKNQLLSSCLILTSQNMAFYWHNASTKEGKKLFAPTLCIWEAIKEAKKRKLKIFDFEGVWDERYPKLNRGWKGFTRFKLSFSN